MKLSGGTAVVTGASRGLGRHIALELARRGMHLILAARTRAGLDEVAQSALRMGVRAECVEIDLCQPGAVEAVGDTAKRLGSVVSLLVNNAGVEEVCALDQLSEGEINRAVRINLTVPMLLARAFLPGMLAQGAGHIVNVASLAGRLGPAFNETYSATKAGLVAFTQSLRASYRARGVSASTICPGFVDDGMYPELVRRSGRRAPRLLGVSGADRVATAVAHAVERDRAEALVNPTPVRPILVLLALFPQLGDLLGERFGANSLFRECARLRASDAFGAALGEQPR